MRAYVQALSAELQRLMSAMGAATHVANLAASLPCYRTLFWCLISITVCIDASLSAAEGTPTTVLPFHWGWVPPAHLSLPPAHLKAARRAAVKERMLPKATALVGAAAAAVSTTAMTEEGTAVWPQPSI